MLNRRNLIAGLSSSTLFPSVAMAAYSSLPKPMPENPWGTYETIPLSLNQGISYWFHLTFSDNWWAIHMNGTLLHSSNSDNGAINREFPIDTFLRPGKNELYFSGYNAPPPAHGANPWKFEWAFEKTSSNNTNVPLISRSVGGAAWFDVGMPATVTLLDIDFS